MSKDMRMDLKGKRLLILGGARICGELIRHARAMGVVTAVTDWYPLEKSPAKQLADEAYYVSTSDIDAMAALIREKRFDGVTTGFTDSVLPYYAEMCERTGLPAYGTREQFEIFIDKARCKELMRAHGVPTLPEYRVDPERFDETAEGIPYPVIVKPTDGSGARGITVCETREELRQALSVAAQASKAHTVLVEQYVEAPEVTVFWLFVDGKYYVTSLANRHVKHNQAGELPLPVGYTYPSSVLPGFLADTAAKMENMFRAVGVRNGMMFMQCKVVDGVCMVFDIGNRTTGSMEYTIFDRLCGFDPMDMLIRFSLTGSMGEPDMEHKADPYLGGKHAYNVSLLCKPGTVAEIRGLEQIRSLPGVLYTYVSHPVGDTITEAMKGRLAQITVRVLGVADTVTEMEARMLEIQRLAHVISDTGEEMILPGIEPSDFVGRIYGG